MVQPAPKKINPNDPNTWPNIAPTPSNPPYEQVPPQQSATATTTGQGNAIRPGPLPRNVGQFDPTVNVSGWIAPEQNTGDPAVYGPAPVPGQAGFTPTPGSQIYDQFTLNQLLREAGMDGWQAVGSYTPVQVTETKIDPSTGEQVEVKTAYYLINVAGPKGEIRQLKLAKVSNPDGTDRYGWSLQNITQEIKPEDRKKGYSGMMTIGGVIWGTNEETGAFERVAGAPEVPQGWSGMIQVDDGKGNKVWYGIDPKDPGSPPKPVPGMPTVSAQPGYSNPYWLKDPGGQTQSLWGYNATTQQLEKVPGAPSQPIETQPISLGNQVYRKRPDGTLEVDPNVSQAREGNERWVPYTGQAGYAKKQRFINGDWQDAVGDPEYLKPVGPEAQAYPPKGTPIQIPVQGAPGKLITVTANGVGGYDMPPPGQAPQVTNVPGLREPTDVTAPAGSEFLPPRRNPDTGALIPGEKNPNWSPTMFSDRVRQLQERAYAKRDELHARIGAGYTEDQANADFNAFWEQQIQPAYQQLQSDQQKELQDAEIKRNNELRAQANQRLNQYTTAQALGQQYVANAQAAEKNMVGPGFGAYASKLLGAIGSGKMPPQPNINDFTYPTPDYNAMLNQFTAQALKYISPSAANMTGPEPTAQPIPKGIDLGGMFDRTRFQPSSAPSITINVGSGAGTSATPAAAAAPATPAAPAAPATPAAGAGLVDPSAWAATRSWSGMPASFGQFQYPV